VDLGMAYERAADPTRALESYAKATSLDRDSPAPYLHTAILQSRLHHVPEANQAFQRVQTLFTAEMNQEGLAELDYQRGYAANENGDSLTAQKLLESSLKESEAIPSVQLEIKVLTQLSSSTLKTDVGKSADYAKQTIRLAHENQLDAWAADGLVRLATAQIRQRQLQDAEGSLNEALQIARQTQQPRVEALGNVTLASLMNQRGLPDQVIEPARAALAYYQQNGYFVGAANASLLLIRVQRDHGQYQQALGSANAFLAMAKKSGVRPLMMQAEEVTGTIYLQKEHYPDALIHFQNAKLFADADTSKAYEALHVAEVLWKVGEFAESEQALQLALPDKQNALWADQIRIKSLLSRNKYREALSLAGQMSTRYPNIEPEDRQEFALDRAIAESHLGMKRQVLRELAGLQTAAGSSDASNDSSRNLVLAEVRFYIGLTQEAFDVAAETASGFQSRGQLDSELRSECLAALAAKQLKNFSEYSIFSNKAVDTISKMEQTWNPLEFDTYRTRPDLQMMLRELPMTASSDRRSL
jgi:hypothetical protein